MRKSFEGLCAIVEQELDERPLSNAYFVFLNRQRDKLKILYFDSDGLAIWYKGLAKGRFPNRDFKSKEISRRELLMLLEGVIPKRVTKRFSIEKK